MNALWGSVSPYRQPTAPGQTRQQPIRRGGPPSRSRPRTRTRSSGMTQRRRTTKRI